jgi:nitric oxide reductase NorD protein
MKASIKRLASGVKNYLVKDRPGQDRRGSATAARQEINKAGFIDVQRRINIYLRALWGSEFIMKPIPADAENRRERKPYVVKHFIHLPDTYHDWELAGGAHVTGLDIYRAAAVHAAAHIIYSNSRFPDQSLNKWQKAVISTIEDARVEMLAIRQFPGLKTLWARQHTATPRKEKTAGDYLDRLSRALLDEAYQDDDPWITRGRELFKAADLEVQHVSVEMGIKLAQAFRKNIKFDIRTDIPGALYRDDNRCLWTPAENESDEEEELPDSIFKFKGAPLESEKVASTSENIKQTEEIFKMPEGGEPISAPYLYGEWDYKSQTITPSWVTLREMLSRPGDLQIIDNIIARNNHLISRMKALLDSLRYGGLRRIRKLEVGDEIDINAAIRARIDIRMHMQPDERVMMRTERNKRDISVLVLLDLSNSMNEKVKGQEHTVLELTQQVCVLFADALEKIGDPFAIHGFCSKSRHFVEYYRLKDFDQPYQDVSKARIAGMTGQLATRMGAAIRHATYHLNQQKSGRKLLMLITDGAPDDSDVFGNKKYLLFDAKKAVEEGGRDGIDTYCVSLDPNADEYVSRIFGAKNYIVFDHIRFMPEKLFLLYAGLTR